MFKLSIKNPLSNWRNKSVVEQKEEAVVVNVRIKGKATKALREDVDDVLNLHADGINAICLKVRQQSDVLLMLGISDPEAAKASMFAQHGLQLANVGRGEDLKGNRLNLTADERIEIVSHAMSAAVMAENLLKSALKNNTALLEYRKNAILEIGY